MTDSQVLSEFIKLVNEARDLQQELNRAQHKLNIENTISTQYRTERDKVQQDFSAFKQLIRAKANAICTHPEPLEKKKQALEILKLCKE